MSFDQKEIHVLGFSMYLCIFFVYYQWNSTSYFDKFKMKKMVTFSTVILANRLCVYSKKCEDWTQKKCLW